MLTIKEKQAFFAKWASDYEQAAKIAENKVNSYKELLTTETDINSRSRINYEISLWSGMYRDAKEICNLLSNYIPKVKIKEAEKNEEENSSYNGYFIHT